MRDTGLTRALERAGWTVDKANLAKRVFNVAVVFNVLICLYFVYKYTVVQQYPFVAVTFAVLIIWFVAFFAVLFSCWLMLYVFLDLRSYQRRIDIEEVLPDYLQLTAANLRAGMTPDRALWFAVRPRFGVLAEEIQTVAKEVMTGASLSGALLMFSRKYDSDLLRRSVNLLIEGMDAGGDLAEILNKVSNTVQETRILDKEMAANILTYVIFIGAATMFAAPVLLALAQQLLATLTQVTGTLDAASLVGAGGLFALSSVSIAPSEFQTFAMVMLTITAFFSAMMIAIIQKGTIQGGIKYIPIFIVTSLVVYWLALRLLGQLITVAV